jgi:hypothetical protein
MNEMITINDDNKKLFFVSALSCKVLKNKEMRTLEAFYDKKKDHLSKYVKENLARSSIPADVGCNLGFIAEKQKGKSKSNHSSQIINMLY